MEGLLPGPDEGITPKSGPLPNRPAPPQAGPAAPEEGVEEEGQELYTKTVDTAYQLIYSNEALPKIRDKIKGSDDLGTAAAEIVSSTMMRVQEAASDAGETIPFDVMLPAMQEVFEDFADLVIDQKVGQLDMEADWMKTVESYRRMEQSAGLANTEGAKQDLEYFKEAEGVGAMGQLFPELGAK